VADDAPSREEEAAADHLADLAKVVRTRPDGLRVVDVHRVTPREGMARETRRGRRRDVAEVMVVRSSHHPGSCTPGEKERPEPLRCAPMRSRFHSVHLRSGSSMDE
jgi:hypothetical protein